MRLYILNNVVFSFDWELNRCYISSLKIIYSVFTDSKSHDVGICFLLLFMGDLMVCSNSKIELSIFTVIYL